MDNTLSSTRLEVDFSPVSRIPAAGGAIKPEAVYPGTGTSSRDTRRLAYIDFPGFYHVSVAISRATLSSEADTLYRKIRSSLPIAKNDAPQLSLDGRQIIFQSGRTGRYEIWRGDADGSKPLEVTFFDKGFPAPR